MSELQELRNMAIHPWVRQMLSTGVIKLEEKLMIQKSKLQNEVVLKPKKSYSEAVTNFKTNDGRKEEVMRRIPTIITSKSILEEKTKHNQSSQVLGNNSSYVRPHIMINGNNKE